jgi:demethylphylloquinone reductase
VPDAAPAGPRVCIVGGGFGGLYTAVKLEGLVWPRGTKPRVTLIDRSERFVFKPLLYELISGAATNDEVAPLYSRLLAPYPITFIRGSVASVQPDSLPTEDSAGAAGAPGVGGTVVLSDGASIPYDWLVLSLGSETATFGIPGAADLAIPFNTYADAVRLNKRLTELERVEYPEVVVVGAGYAGVELAAVVAERLKGRGLVRILTSGQDVLEGCPEGQRDASRRALTSAGVAIMPGTSVVEVAAAPDDAGSDDTGRRVVKVKGAATGLEEVLIADVVLWTAGAAPATRPSASADGPRHGVALPFPTDARGAAKTDATLRVLDNPRVFALGDVAVSRSSSPTSPMAPRLPPTAQVAFQQADYVAWNLWASINGRAPLRFSYQHLGDMMSLGSSSGAVSLPIPVPPPVSAAALASPLGAALEAAGVRLTTGLGGASGGVTVEGPLAAALRRAAYLYRQPTDEQRFMVAAEWAAAAVKQASEVAQRVMAPAGTGAGGGKTSASRGGGWTSDEE